MLIPPHTQIEEHAVKAAVGFFSFSAAKEQKGASLSAEFNSILKVNEENKESSI